MVALAIMKPIAMAVEVEPMSYLGGTPTKITMVHFATDEWESRVPTHLTEFKSRALLGSDEQQTLPNY